MTEISLIYTNFGCTGSSTFAQMIQARNGALRASARPQLDSSLLGSEVAKYGSNRSSMADDQHRCLILVHGPQEADEVSEETLHIKRNASSRSENV